MNLVFALGLLVAGGILMYAGVKGETLAEVMNTIKTKGATLPSGSANTPSTTTGLPATKPKTNKAPGPNVSPLA
jgi:hypothetical protein